MLSGKLRTNLIASLSMAVIMLAGIVQAAASDIIADGDNGTLNVTGELTRGACNIETTSRWQSINMENVTTGELASPGNRGHATAFHLHLRDCEESGTDEARKQNGTVLRIVNQPEIRISFVSERDADDTELFAIQGAKGFGLRLEDAQYNTIAPGGKAQPLALEGGNNVLTYWLVPERTHGEIQEGVWHSVISMRFSYE